MIRHFYPVLVTVGAILFGLAAPRLYYLVKPMLPRRLRLSFRRVLAHRQRQKSVNTWPIFQPAGQPPAGWKGWPNGQRFAFVLTHDVESEVGLQRVKQLAELEMSLGFRSSFNFIPEGPYQVPDELRAWLKQNGFEVGVHDHRHDGKLFQSQDRFQASAKRINHFLRQWNAKGFRSGFMLRNLEWIHELDVLYDSSTFDTDPFEPQPDGAHTIFPFWVASADRGYVELPYTLVQDSTLFLILQERSSAIWKDKLAWIAAQGGMALVDTHPDYTSFDTGHTWGEYPVAYYREFLEAARQAHGGDYWPALPCEVAKFYLQWHRSLPAETSVTVGEAVLPLYEGSAAKVSGPGQSAEKMR